MPYTRQHGGELLVNPPLCPEHCAVPYCAVLCRAGFAVLSFLLSCAKSIKRGEGAFAASVSLQRWTQLYPQGFSI